MSKERKPAQDRLTQHSLSQQQQPNSGRNGRLASRESKPSRTGGSFSQTETTKKLDEAQKIHEVIVDLYLQVKIRSNEEIDMFEQDQFKNERERLSRIDSITVLKYIRTSIEILMQMKLDEEKEGGGNRTNAMLGRMSVPEAGGAPSELTSTFQSLDLPPKEYEQQLQQYEAEVRNHIKVEQQLKLHIEVLQEKIDDLEKGIKQDQNANGSFDKSAFQKKFEELEKRTELEKAKQNAKISELEKAVEGFDKRVEQEKQAQEKKLKVYYAKFLTVKEQEMMKLKRELKNLQDVASLERGRTEAGSNQTQNMNAVKVVRLNNFVGGKGKKDARLMANSHSPSTAVGKDGNSLLKPHIKKSLKVGKNPYLNDCFKKGSNQQSTSTNQSELSSSSSAKADRKGASSAEISESSMIVLKKNPKQMPAGGGQNITASSVKPVDQQKLLAVIQGMRKINPSSQSQIPQKNGQLPTTTGSKGKIVSLTREQPQQVSISSKKTTAKTQNLVTKPITSNSRQSTDTVSTQMASAALRSSQEDNVATVIQVGNNKNLVGKKSTKHKQYSSLDGKQDSEASQATVMSMPQQEMMSNSVPMHNSLVEHNLSGSQHLGSSLQKTSNSKPGIRTQNIPRGSTGIHEGKMPQSASSKKATSQNRKSQHSKDMLTQNNSGLMKQMSHHTSDVNTSVSANHKLSSKNVAYQQAQKQRMASSGNQKGMNQSDPDQKHDLIENNSNSTMQDFMQNQGQIEPQPANQQDFISQYQQISYHHQQPNYHQSSNPINKVRNVATTNGQQPSNDPKGLINKKSAAVASRTRPRSQTGGHSQPKDQMF